MASRNTKAISFATTHPTTAWRSAALEKVIEEIRDKKAKGLVLKPNLKKIPKPPPETDEELPE